MKNEYAFIFESEDRIEDIFKTDNNEEIKEGSTVTMNGITGTIRRILPKMPTNYYSFETYTTGYTKGFNDYYDNLHGKKGEYEEEYHRISKEENK